jgi:hypothetical protein
VKKNVELLETLNFKQIVGLDWPVELKDGIIEKKYNKEIFALNASFSFKNFMNKKIIYTEWELICKDILDRSLDTVVVKSDSKIAPQESTGIDSISLPEHTRYFIPKLLAVVYDTKEIVKMTERVLINEVTDRNLINRLQSFDEELLKNYQKDKNLPDIPKFVYERYTNGIWTCAFCGTRNASEHSECHICEIGTDLSSVPGRIVTFSAKSGILGHWKRDLAI